jgi:Fe-S oxidoreductase
MATGEQEHIEKMNEYGVRKIVTTCPHCFNTIKNEYSVFGGNYEVTHHTQLLSDLAQAGKITLSKAAVEGISITLHDACYAARHNNMFEEPRRVLEQSGQNIKEMKRCGNLTFCCGADGSNYWYDVPQRESMAEIRMQESKGTGASTLVTECPFCLAMFEDSVKVTKVNLSVKDVAEMVAGEIPRPA